MGPAATAQVAAGRHREIMAGTDQSDSRPWWRRVLAAIKRVALAIGRPIQRAVLWLLLVVLYVVGVGATCLWAQLFKRRVMTGRAPAGAATFFVDATDYRVSLQEGRHGS